MYVLVCCFRYLFSQCLLSLSVCLSISPDAAVTHYQLLSSDGVKFTARVLKRLLELCGEQNSTWSGARAMHPPSVAIELFACIRTEQGYLTGGDYFVLMKILAKFDMFMQ